MTTGTGIAKENDGRTPSYRNEADARGGLVRRGKPNEEINFIRVVPGSRIPTDAWLEVEPGVFVNYKVGGTQYYNIIKEPEGTPTPDPEPEPTPEVPPLTVTVTIKGTGYKTKVLEVDLEPDGN